jgi:insertion element IS1 protein InsB
VLGDRDTATFQRLYEKLRLLTDCSFYSDKWASFAEVLPPQRHVVGKAHTVAIERDNSNTRHHLARFTRRTKVVSKSKEMVERTIRLWCWLTTPEIFTFWQKQALTIYK